MPELECEPTLLGVFLPSTPRPLLGRKIGSPIAVASPSDLDSIVWEPGQIAVQRPANAIAAALDQFLMETHVVH